MAGTTSLFIIGILILESGMCWGLGDRRTTTLSSYDASPCIFFSDSYTFQDVITWLDVFTILDVNTIWLDSIFPRAERAGIVTNFTDVYSKLGSMADFERLVDTAHKQGIKVIIRVLPFETHFTHEWFKKWRYNVSPYNDFYVTVAGKLELDGGYNTEDAINYQLAINSKAWCEERKSLYLVNFMNAPCLDLSNPEVRSRLNKEIFDFWLNKGVDGFVIEQLSQYVFNSEWLPPNGTIIMDSNKLYLHEVREVVDNWAIEHNSTYKYLGVSTTSFESARSPHTIENLFNFSSIVLDFPMISNAGYMKSYLTSMLGFYSPAVINNEVIWTSKTRAVHLGLPQFIASHIFAMLMPGKVRLQMLSEFDGERINRWDTSLAHRVVYLKQMPVFKYGDWQIESLNDDAVLVLRRELRDDPMVYLVVLNTSMKPETVNMTTAFSDLNKHLRVVLTSSLKDARRALRFVPRDSVTLSRYTTMVLTSLRPGGNETAKDAGIQPYKRPQRE